LTPVRVDGWKQGWLVPAGRAATVTLTYGPDTAYRAGLGIGVLGVLAAIALAWRRGVSDAPPLGPDRIYPWVDAAVVCLALGLLVGWLGFALGVLAIGAARLLPTVLLLGGEVALVPAVLLAAGGVVQAVQRSETHVTTSAVAQVLVVAALATGAALVLASGPEFFSRRKGRSSP
jgi:arabinofuranan 3-O-arabinosyltransferase